MLLSCPVIPPTVLLDDKTAFGHDTSFFHQETKIGKLLIQAWVSQVGRDTARLGSCSDAHMKTTGGRACDDGGSQ